MTEAQAWAALEWPNYKNDGQDWVAHRCENPECPLPLRGVSTLDSWKEGTTGDCPNCGRQFTRIIQKKPAEYCVDSYLTLPWEKLYNKFVEAGDLVFDVGANVGDRTATFRAMGARVVAVEPHPECIEALRKRYAEDTSVTVIDRAVSNHEGPAALISGDTSAVSSISEEWIAAVRKTDRFPGHEWNKRHRVDTTTLDCLIREFGHPSFIKIDVEGWEVAVILGLSTPVKALSFEFTPEFLGAARQCVEKLQSLGDYRFCYSLKESLKLYPEWLPGDALLSELRQFENDSRIYGDVYAQLQHARTDIGSSAAE
jgi:FkbM family methyltransferase